MRSTITQRASSAATIIAVALVTGGCGVGGPPTVVATPVDGGGDGAVIAAAGDADDLTAAMEVPGSAAADRVAQLFVRVEFERITDEQLAALRALDGVADVVARRGDDVALVGSRRRDGTAVDDLPADFKISVGAVVDDEEVGLGLAAGEVAMTTTGLAFRDLDEGGTVELAGGLTTTIVEVTDRPDLAGYELVVSVPDAERLGVRTRQRAQLVLAPDADVASLLTATQDVVGDNGIVQPRRAAEVSLVLSLAETKRLFGEFAFKDLAGRDIQQGVSFIESNIVRRDVPFFGRITCHEAIFDPLIGALQQIRDEGLGDEIIPSQYGGCWAPRRINRNANLSRHAWGIGVDINVDFEAPGLGPIPSEGVIAAFEDHGFVWGGDYPIPDNHHFEYHGGHGG